MGNVVFLLSLVATKYPSEETDMDLYLWGIGFSGATTDIIRVNVEGRRLSVSLCAGSWAIFSSEKGFLKPKYENDLDLELFREDLLVSDPFRPSPVNFRPAEDFRRGLRDASREGRLVPALSLSTLVV